MAQTVVGFFDDAQDARRAVEQLVSNGFDRSRIDVSSGNSGTGMGTASTSTDRGGDSENGISRFFKNLFGDNDDEADRYSRVGMNSNSIVTVHAQSADEAERAADLLDDYGAVNVNERASQYGTSGASSTSGMASMASNTPDYDRSSDSDRSSDYDNTRLASDSDRGGLFGNTGTTRDRSDEDATVQRVEENLEVGKRTVERGGVRVRSRIVERPVEEHIRLREEHVNVERTPVDRPLGQNEMANFQEREIELTERSEVPVVNKEARVVEEIRVSKDVEERQETVRDNVRSTEVDIENLGDTDRRTNVSGTGNYSDNTTGNLNRDTDFDDDDLTTRNSRI
jgi:stress response protein YsnF